MSVLSADEEGLVLTVKWREDFISSPEIRSTHGGILAAIIDATGDYAVAIKVGHPVPTVDMRVDYHRVAYPGDLRAEGRVINLGKSMATAEARVLDASGKLVASGRALYLIRAPQGK
ncbi:PaaI family thioesterase [Alcaligenaceae bacterium]|nr:PaaI family thioesterase [Alcaligenaceae bacterium]